MRKRRPRRGEEEDPKLVDLWELSGLWDSGTSISFLLTSLHMSLQLSLVFCCKKCERKHMCLMQMPVRAGNKAGRSFGCMEKISVIMRPSTQICFYFFDLIIKLN